MAEEDRLDPNKLMGWIDFETSALDVHKLTALEFGYTITSMDLKQRTPVRSRLCGFTSGDNPLLTPRSEDWDHVAHEAVQRLHVDSGLTSEYRAASEWTIVRSMAVLDQMFIDDLFTAGWDGISQVILAGSGIAAFDRRILAQFSSRLVHLAHYRSADVSAACEVLGVKVPKTSRELDSLLAAWGSPAEANIDFEVGQPMTLHRAACDVAGSLLIARALRNQMGKRT